MTRLRVAWGFGCVVLATALAASAAPPAIPLALSYQGVLLDDQGAPRTGAVDLVLRLYDAPTAGVLVYKQTFTSVALADGVFSVTLGPSGDGTDVPTDPLTTSLADAIDADVGPTAPDRFLEVTVGATGALARTQLLATPYAIRAESADVADFALDAGNVGGLSSEVLGEIYAHFNFDGGPPNDDPLEGLADFDGDGIANFVDPDNDNDSLSDQEEVDQGSGVNAVTPVVDAVTPDPILWSGDTLAISGLNFEAGMSVTVGTEAVAPQGITETSFSADTGQLPKGPVTVEIIRVNGERGTWLASVAADQPHALPFLTGAHLGAAVNAAQQLVVTDGASGRVDTTFDGLLDADVEFTSGSGGRRAVGWSPAGRMSALVTHSTAISFYVDTTGGYSFSPAERRDIQTFPSGNARSGDIAFDAAGGRVAAYLLERGSLSAAVVAHDRDANDDFLGPNEYVEIEPLAASPTPAPGLGAVAVDAAGQVAYAYFDVATGRLRLAYDRSGDGDYDDTVSGHPELATLLSAPDLACVGMAFDPSGVLSIVYAEPGGAAFLLRDFDANGEFSGPGESEGVGAAPVSGCDVAAGGGPGLSLTHDGGGLLQLLVDTNGDDDFDDPGESLIVGSAAGGPYAPLAIDQGTGGRSVLVSAEDVFLWP